MKTWLLKHKFKLSVFFLLIILYWLWLPAKLFNVGTSAVLLDENNALLAAQIAPDGQWRFPQSDSVPVKFKTCILITIRVLIRYLFLNPSKEI